MEDYPGQRRGTSGRAERLNERLLDEFVALHGPALRASGVPERLWGSLLHKLEHEVRDCGRVMQTIGERSPAAPRAHLQAPDWCVCLRVIGRPAESCTCAAILQGLDPAKDELGSADWHTLGSRHLSTSAAANRLRGASHGSSWRSHPL